jgi:hypothetical protein
VDFGKAPLGRGPYLDSSQDASRGCLQYWTVQTKKVWIPRAVYIPHEDQNVPVLCKCLSLLDSDCTSDTSPNSVLTSASFGRGLIPPWKLRFQ